MLEVFLQFEANTTMPVTSELVDNLKGVLEGAPQGGYDTDEALFYVALAIAGIENSLVQAKTDRLNLNADLLNLKTDLLNAGIRLSPPQ
jgi:hypothetical protein